jgi:flagellar basal-body rod modification protein FlgD
MTISTGNSYLDTLAKAQPKSGSGASGKSNQTIDQSGFLKLLTTQMTTQDPTAPTDNSQMVQQMATFSQVAGITEMNQSMKDMVSTLTASRFGTASSWVGHAALVNSEIAAPASNGAYAGEITLGADASNVTLSLVDQDGKVVHSEQMGAKSAGAVDWTWDGKDTDGKAVAGPLKMVVSAPAASGTGQVENALAAWTEIASVQSPVSGSTKLVTALGSFAPGDIQAVS